MNRKNCLWSICTSLLLIGFTAIQLPAQDQPSLIGAAVFFAKAERKLNNGNDYWQARQKLEQDALQLAETNLKSKDAEDVLKWILSSPRTSPSSLKAADYLAKHHYSSKSMIQWLVNIRPRQWTPSLFANLLASKIPEDLRVIVEFSKAMHDKQLLELSDQIRRAKGNFSEFELVLGKEITKDLLELDEKTFTRKLIETFETLAKKYGKTVIGGASIEELCAGSIFSIKHLRLGKTATELEGVSFSGKKTGLGQHKGKVVLVDFWATWCAPCITAMPQLKAFKSKLANEKFEVIGVAADENLSNVESFVKKHAIFWPMILDSDNRIQKRWAALSLPTYYVLDQDHVVRYRGTSLSDAMNSVEEILGTSSVSELVRLTFEAFDKNNDNRIAKSELPKGRQAIFKSADLNNDGFLNVEEVEKFTKANMKSSEDKQTPKDDE